jgi:hypothetical protein
MAETEGFEPSVELSPHTRLAIEHLRPLGHVSICTEIAEVAVGFEPTNRLRFPVFKTGAFNHSATPPRFGSILESENAGKGIRGRIMGVEGSFPPEQGAAPHVGLQCLGYGYASIFLLVVFDHRDQAASDGQR